ncbi:TIGR01244 family sulfur transferase [Aminobacter sp. Piv2-1]|uniref:TIGR01244 family sulfur transferase n=1 Tax=Aminobacter sp. Piv2-1 TaxID=3031122 RepID=UPI00403F2E71
MPRAMWPFSLFHNSSQRKIRKIDEQFSTAGQIRPEDIKGLAHQGFVAIVCARPDNEQRDQPSFAEIAHAARQYGMKAVHIPVGGVPSPDHIHRLKKVMATTDGPVLSYCRSGARSAALYLSIRR